VGRHETPITHRLRAAPTPSQERKTATVQQNDADYEVVIVGSGLMGAAVARTVREAQPNARILMLDGGSSIGSIRGQHLHDVQEPHIWKRYNERVSSGIQGFYAGAAPMTDVGSTIVGREPGMYHLSSIGEDAREMPAAAVGCNLGGMSVHWTAATPPPWGSEIPNFIDDDEWKKDLQEASRLLRVNPEPFPETAVGAEALRVLRELFDGVSAPGRGPQHMPMAVQPDTDGVKRRTGPNTIFEPIRDAQRDANFTLLPSTQVIRLLHDGHRVNGVRTRDVATEQHQDIQARVTVVCADAIRTPQLLFASQIRPTALGRYLNEHAFLSGRVLTDPNRLRFRLDEALPQEEGENSSEHLWLPHSGPRQPFHVQIANRVHIDNDHRPLAYSVGLGFYVPTEVRAENRLEFSDELTDATGMPQMRVHFSYTDLDKRSIDQAREVQRKTAEALGPFDPATESALLPAGSSLHFTGTVRMGPADDGTSVCDSRGKMWGFDNLFVAGNGVVPTALACNSTLTGMVTAVRAGHNVAAILNPLSSAIAR
jgi:choline dehydrogenase-like flavoprotein